MWHQRENRRATENVLTISIPEHPLQAPNKPITALRCNETGLRSLSGLKEYVDPTLALHMSFMAFNTKQNIIIQHDMTSLSTGVELWEW